MTIDIDETIAAIASPRGSGLRGIIRVSGNDTAKILKLALRPSAETCSQFDRATTAIRWEAVIALQPDVEIDLQILFWPDRRSYTRQPAAEIHCLGSPGLLEMLLERLVEAGSRRAEPGEFTMRAFLAGRLDLVQAEAVMGVIEAENRRQLDFAVAQLAGGIGGPAMDVRDRLMGILANLEAGLDFAEEDIEFISRRQLVDELTVAQSAIDSILTQIKRRRSDSSPLAVVLMGRPNVGKSSLFNKLVGGNAIVSERSGTTRDYIKSTIEINGSEIELFDTAGLEEERSSGTFAQRLADQTAKAIQMADLKILCLESGTEPDPWEESVRSEADESLIIAFTKCDLDYDPTVELEAGIQTSAVRAMGLVELKEEIGRRMGGLISDETHASATVARSSQSLTAAASSIQLALSLAEHESQEELIAVEVRTALDYLGRVVGKIYTDDILEFIFSRFCIGK